MALHILQGLSPADEYKMGASKDLAQMLGSGLEALTANKMKQLQGKAFGKFSGVSPQLAQVLPYLDPKIQKIILERGVEGGDGAGQASAPDELFQQLQKIYDAQQPMEEMEQQESPEMSRMQAFNMMYGSPEGMVAAQDEKEIETPLRKDVQNVRMYDRELQSIKNAEKPGLKLGKTSQEKYQQQVLDLKKDELLNKRNAETRSMQKEAFEAARNAKSDLRDLNRMLELDQKNELDTPGFSAFLERSGLNVQALRSPGSEEFINLRKNFFRGLKENFGSRLNQFEVEQYLEAIPSLLNSREGRKRIIENQKLNSQARSAKFSAINEIIKENNGRIPVDFYEQLDEKLDKKLDKLSEQFRKNIEKPVGPEQNRLITALQTGAGSILGAPGALLKKASSSGGASGAATALEAL